jgi:hypothetical protein
LIALSRRGLNRSSRSRNSSKRACGAQPLYLSRPRLP